MAVMAGMPRQAPASKLTLSGSFTACAAGSAINSAAGPKARFHCPFQTQTRSPRRDLAMPSPTLVDLACAVAVRDQARPGDLAGRTLARFDIGRVDAGVAEFDPHLAGAGLRRLDLSHAQYLARGTVLFVIGGSHALSPRVIRNTITWRRERNPLRNRSRGLSAIQI